ncbi:MAG: hypothetical protein U9N61_09790 [Euryarchaeota archaeon]|nr:hypothetical protein [Euryarchaeota archaeon]
MMFGTLKYKLVAVGSALVIAIFALIKWLYASNQAKKEKIVSLKRESKIAKVVTDISNDTAEYNGFQKAINREMNRLADDTEKARVKQSERKLNESDYDDGFTSVNV